MVGDGLGQRKAKLLWKKNHDQQVIASEGNLDTGGKKVFHLVLIEDCEIALSIEYLLKIHPSLLCPVAVDAED